jgi:hypothetical protein
LLLAIAAPRVLWGVGEGARFFAVALILMLIYS